MPKRNVDLAMHHLSQDIEEVGFLHLIIQILHHQVLWMNQSTTLVPFRPTNLLGPWDPRNAKWKFQMYNLPLPLQIGLQSPMTILLQPCKGIMICKRESSNCRKQSTYRKKKESNKRGKGNRKSHCGQRAQFYGSIAELEKAMKCLMTLRQWISWKVVLKIVTTTRSSTILSAF